MIINRLNLANNMGLSLTGSKPRKDVPAPPLTFKILITPEAEALLATAQEKKDMLDSASTMLRQNPPPGDKVSVMGWNKVITMVGSFNHLTIQVMTNQQFANEQANQTNFTTLVSKEAGKLLTDEEKQTVLQEAAAATMKEPPEGGALRVFDWHGKLKVTASAKKKEIRVMTYDEYNAGGYSSNPGEMN